VDLRQAPRVPEAGAVPWTEALDEAVRGALERKEQVILLLNRRGFATFLQCPRCGDVRECPRCAIALTIHRTPAALRCHYCGHEEPVPTSCRACGHDTERMRGIGTQQLEHFLELRFPAARLARMDLDTTSSKWSHHRILERVARRGRAPFSGGVRGRRAAAAGPAAAGVSAARGIGAVPGGGAGGGGGATRRRARGGVAAAGERRKAGGGPHRPGPRSVSHPATP